MLTDAAIKKSRPLEKTYHLTDSGGLSLHITPAGGKLWRLRYRFGGKQQMISLGKYPDVSLKEARETRDKLKRNLNEGINPSMTRKLAKLAPSHGADHRFESIAREWHALQAPTWTAIHGREVLGSLESDVFPHLGNVHIDVITPPIVLAVLRKIEARGALETARRVRQRISAVFTYAIASGRGRDDPAAIVKGAMAPIRKGRQPAVADLATAREVLAAVDNTPAHPVTKLAMRLLALTVIRPGALIQTPWSEVCDLSDDEPVWQIPAHRMKLRLAHKSDSQRDHLVPLSIQAVEVIEALKNLTGRGPLVFPNARFAHKPMSENALGYLLNRAGYNHRHVPHGWRATFSTIMNEHYPADQPVIDIMLAHTPKDKVEAAYNRALYIRRRQELMQLWANMLLVDAMPVRDILKMPMRINKRDKSGVDGVQ